MEPDVFVGLGDMIYADNACDATGRYGNAQIGGLGVAVDLTGFWEHWRSNRADRASQRLLRSTSYVGVWDARLSSGRPREETGSATRSPLVPY